MPEKSISDQIIDRFIENVAGANIIEKENLDKLKSVLDSGKVKKEDILEAIGGKAE